MPGPSPLGVKRSDSAVGLAFTPTEGQPGFKRARKRKILPIQAVPGLYWSDDFSFLLTSLAFALETIITMSFTR